LNRINLDKKASDELACDGEISLDAYRALEVPEPEPES